MGLGKMFMRFSDLGARYRLLRVRRLRHWYFCVQMAFSREELFGDECSW